MGDAVMNFAEWSKLFEGVTITFSPYCISGLVADCKCARCLRSRGEEVTSETEEAARVRSVIESKKFRERVFKPRP